MLMDTAAQEMHWIYEKSGLNKDDYRLHCEYHWYIGQCKKHTLNHLDEAITYLGKLVLREEIDDPHQKLLKELIAIKRKISHRMEKKLPKDASAKLSK